MTLAIVLKINLFTISEDTLFVPILMNSGMWSADTHRQSIGETLEWKTIETQ